MKSGSHGIQRVEHIVHCIVHIVPGGLDLFLFFLDLRDIGEAPAVQGPHDKGQSVGLEGICPDPECVFTVLSGKPEKSGCPEIADRLYLGIRCVQGQDVVQVEGGDAGQHVVVSGIFRSLQVGTGGDLDLNLSLFAREVLGLFRNTVQTVGEGESPGQFLKRSDGLSFKIKMVRSAVSEGKAQGTAAGHRLGAVREIGYRGISAIICDLVGAVQLVAFDDARVGEVSVVIKRDVICFVHSRDHAGRDCRQCAAGRSRQQEAQT